MYQTLSNLSIFSKLIYSYYFEPLGCKRPDDNPDMELREICFKLRNDGKWKRLNGIEGIFIHPMYY